MYLVVMVVLRPASRWLFLIFLCSGLSIPAMSQRAHLSKRITISYTSVPLDDILAEISKTANFNFSYNADLINGDSLVSLEVESERVGEVLDELFGDRIRGKEVGNHVILMQHFTRGQIRDARAQTEYIVSGYVLDARNGHRLKDATIYEVSKRKTILSDAGGRYRFPLPKAPGIQGLYFSKSGYFDTVVFIRPTDNINLDVNLNPRYGELTLLTSRPATLPVNLIDSMVLVNALVPRRALVTSENLQVYGTRGFQASLIPYVGTNWMSKGAYSNAISFNLLAGYTGGVNGLELGGLVNIVRNDVRGLQIGGLANIVGRNVMGVQVGGLFNVNLGKYQGVQVSGLMNYQKDTLTGVQVGGLCNWLEGRMEGVQVGGLLNVTTGHADGWQVAGLVNVAVKDVKQIQIGGLFNYGRHVYGVELAGLINISNGNVTGIQVGGLFNYARNVNGVQVGAFNFARTVESGVPIGFFSYVHKGGLHNFSLYGDEVFYANVSFRAGTKRFYNIFQVGVGNSWMLNYMYGLGTSFTFGEKWILGLEIISGLVFQSTPNMALHGTLTKVLPSIEYRFWEHFAIFAGPTFNLYAFDSSRTYKPDGIAPYTFFDQEKGIQRIQMWIGGTVGFRF